jgi:DNA repair protein RadC
MLQIALHFACPKRRPELLAAELLKVFGSYAGALAASSTLLRRIPGMDRRAIFYFKLLREGGLRVLREEAFRQPIRGEATKPQLYLQALLSYEKAEQFRVMFLDRRRMLLGEEILGKGIINHVPVYPRMIAERACAFAATAIILVHNHPSGDPTPSADDLTMTQSIKYTLRQLGIWLYDHLIVGNGRCVSLRNEGFCDINPPLSCDA